MRNKPTYPLGSFNALPVNRRQAQAKQDALVRHVGPECHSLLCSIYHHNRPLRSTDDLSSLEHRLYVLVRNNRHAEIEGLEVHSGDPVLDPAPLVIQHFKFGTLDAPADEMSNQPCDLKKPFVDFFRVLRSIEEGRIRALQIRHGLPFTAEIELIKSPQRASECAG